MATKTTKRESSTWIKQLSALVAAALFASACSGATIDTTSTAPESTSQPSNTTSSSTPSTTAAIASVGNASQLAEILEQQTAAVAGSYDGGFIGIGNKNSNGAFTVVDSGDGSAWTEREDPIVGLPEDFEGPYRIWRFGEGYLIYGESAVGTTKAGATEPFVATSDDLANWEHVEMSGIDSLFYNGWQSAHGPGDVAEDGSLAIFVEDQYVADVGRQPNMWLLEPDQDPITLPNDQGIYNFTIVDSTVVGITSASDRRRYRLWVLEDDKWSEIPAPPANMRLGAELRSVGDTLAYLSTGESWFSRDLGSTWTQSDPLDAGRRNFGYFGPNGSAGPAEPPYGTPDTFAVSSDGANWKSVELPDGAAEIRHLVTTEDGILSLVTFTSPPSHQTLFTPGPLADSESSSDPATPAPSANLPALDDLWALTDRTVALPRMSYELDVTSTIPGATAPVVARRTGSFDDDTLSGIGTRSFESADRTLAEVLELSFEIRIVDDLFWMKVTDGTDEDWGGFDLDEFATFTGGDPSASVDGDLMLLEIVAAAEEIVDHQMLPDGGAEWSVTVRADELIDVVTAGGPAARLTEAGAASSGIYADLVLTESQDGFVTAASIDLDEWWTNALSLTETGLPTGLESMNARFTMQQFDEQLTPEAPCQQPTPTQDDDGATIFRCTE